MLRLGMSLDSDAYFFLGKALLFGASRYPWDRGFREGCGAEGFDFGAGSPDCCIKHPGAS
jgi:hypothetical protein